MVKIFLDPGHGGSDPGANGNGLREKDLTLDISKRIKKYLDDNYSGHTVKLSRTGDKSLSLPQRTNMANKWGADYLLSVHINAGGGTGYEDFIYNGSVQKSTANIRDVIHDSIIREIGKGVRNRGKKRANFHMVRESKMPAMLSENLFIDTKADADKLKDSKFLNKIAIGHAKGLARAFNLKGGTSTSKPSKPKSKPATSHTKVTKRSKLSVDGSFGPATTRALQRHFGTIVDGVISGQPKNRSTRNIPSAKYGTTGSNLIRAMQRHYKSGTVDGVIGNANTGKSNLIVTMQRKYNLKIVDGVVSLPSNLVKEIQRRLNNGTL